MAMAGKSCPVTRTPGSPADVDFAFSPEQEELRRTVRQFLDKTSPEAEVRRVMATERGYDAGTWRRMAQELGLLGLAIPEAYGGAGAGFTELGIVAQEMGRALFCGPFLGTAVLAAAVLLEAGDDGARDRWLPPIAAGDLIATLALPPALSPPIAVPSSGIPRTSPAAGATSPGITPTSRAAGATSPGITPSSPAAGTLSPFPLTIEAREPDAAGGWTLDGTAGFVLDGHVADLILVPAAAPGGTSLFAVASDAPGLTRTLLPALDATRKHARLDFAAAPATLAGPAAGAIPALARVFGLACVALACEQVGVAERALDMARDYALLRTQFGRPIGSFQAVKHKLAHGPAGTGSRPLRGLVRAVGRRLRPGRAAGGGEHRPGGLLRGRLPGHRGEHPGPRRDRLHLGASRAPVLPAGDDVAAVAGRPGRAP